MPFGAVSVRVVEKFLIVFRNDSPMLYAVNAGARRTIKRGPKPFKGKQCRSISSGEAALQSSLGTLRKDDPFFSNKAADEDRAALPGKALRMSRWQDFDGTGGVAA